MLMEMRKRLRGYPENESSDNTASSLVIISPAFSLFKHIELFPGRVYPHQGAASPDTSKVIILAASSAVILAFGEGDHDHQAWMEEPPVMAPTGSRTGGRRRTWSSGPAGHSRAAGQGPAMSPVRSLLPLPLVYYACAYSTTTSRRTARAATRAPGKRVHWRERCVWAGWRRE